MRRQQKLKYRGEFFPASASADGRLTFAEYFQIDKYSGNAKGIVRVLLPQEAEGREDHDHE
jgi:hypothetical protein